MSCRLSLVALGGAITAFAQGPGVQLGGTFVPKEKIVVYILMGNSALSGRDPARDLATHPRAWNYVIKDPVNEHPGLKPNTWEPAKAPLHVDSRKGNMQDPGSAMIKLLAAAAPPDYHVGALQISEGALTAAHFRRGGVHYDAVMTEAIRLRSNVTFGGLVSMVGIVEGQQGGSHVTGYLGNLKTMVAHVREDLGRPDLPYIHSCFPVLAEREHDTDLATVKQLRAIEPQIPGAIANALLIPTYGLTIYLDNNRTHYDSAGCKAWGRRVTDSLAARGWAPGGSAAIRVRAHGRVAAGPRLPYLDGAFPPERALRGLTGRRLRVIPAAGRYAEVEP